MLRIAIKPKLTPGEAIRQAVEFFGPDGYQLEIKDKAPACAEFEGGGEAESRLLPASMRKGPL